MQHFSITDINPAMATTKSMKIQAEIDKVKAKISEQQARLKELEQKKLEAENSEIDRSLFADLRNRLGRVGKRRLAAFLR